MLQLSHGKQSIEASSHKAALPVIVAPSGALDEYVEDGETGWVVEPEHPPSLARCLSAMLSDVDRLARMGAAGRAWYDARRDAEEQELCRMYKNMAGDVG